MFRAVTTAIQIVILLLTITPAPSFAQQTGTNHIVGAGDTLSIQVYGEPELTLASVKVLDDGVISMLMIGEIRLVGKTLNQIESEITRRLANGYLLKPVVTVSVAQFRPFFIVGKVSSPGSKAYVDKMTIRKAIVLAGGLTEQGDSNNITIERAGSRTGPQLVDDSTRVGPGDIISVGSLGTFSVRGAVQFPDDRIFQSTITVKKAIAMAGGFNTEADINNINLERGGEVYAVADSIGKILVQPDDLITVATLTKSEKDKDIVKSSYFLQGEVGRTGQFEHTQGLTVETAIVISGGFSARASKRKITIRRQGDPPILMKRVKLDEPVLPGDIVTVGASIF